jgi:uncharacterized repeat protein (TIGR01451 family)
MKRFIVLVGTLLFVFAGAKLAFAGPIIIDGTDANDHGGVSSDGLQNVNGWSYMQQALEHLGEQVYTGTYKVVVDLGTTNAITTLASCSGRGHNARQAIDSAFNLSSLPSQGWTLVHVDGAVTITQWLNNLSWSNTGILYIPTYNNLCGDLDPDELAAINAHAVNIVNYVNGPGDATRGGALFAQSERNESTGPKSIGSYLWLQSAVPGIFAAGFNGDITTPISLTLDGVTAFPGLTNADLSTGPWHNWFEGNFDNLKTLAVAQNLDAITKTVILGGGTGTRFGPKLPELSVTKVDYVPNAIGHIAAPGDTIFYTVTIANIDPSQTVTNVVFVDTPDPNTTLVPGSVSTTQGSVTTGNTAGDSSVGVNVGNISPGNSVSIVFRVTIHDLLAAGVTQISNQGFVQIPGATIPTQDPGVPIPGGPTVTPITTKPLLAASKTDWLYSDGDGNGVPSPGDTIGYTVTVGNNGVTATQVTFSDIPGLYTRLVTGSVTTTAGTIASGNGVGNTDVVVNIGDLGEGHATVTITFRVQIDNPVPAGVTQIVNQGFVSSKEIPTIPTDDPKTPRLNDPTVTAITAAPLLEITKSAVVYSSTLKNGKASPGDELLYQVAIINNGNTAATGVVFADSPDTNTSLIVGSVNTTGGAVITGNTPGDTSILIVAGTIPAGHGEVDISFRVHINVGLPGGVTQVSNQGTVTSTQMITPLPTDDPSTLTLGDPTVTPLIERQGEIKATKSGALFTDADHNGVTSPGDTLLYSVHIANTGDLPIDGVVYSDTLDLNTNLTVGSVQATTGTVTRGNNPGDISVVVDIGTIPGGQSVDITYRTVITNPWPAGVTEVVNQGTISSNTGPITKTCDPNPNNPCATTITVTVNMPLQLIVASDVGLCALPGSSYNVTWTVANIGDAIFPGGLLNTLVTGSGSGPLTATLPAVAPNTTGSVNQTVLVSEPVPYGAETVTVTGSILTTTAQLVTHICAPDFRTSSAKVVSHQVFAHEELTYTWHISNTGDAAAPGTTAVLTLPVNALFSFQDNLTSTTGLATFNAGTNVVTWAGNMPIGSSVTITFTAQSVFGLPHGLIEAPFEVDQPYRPPFISAATYTYPYKLYFMLVLRGAASLN